jgi:phosphoglycolate phosphatase
MSAGTAPAVIFDLDGTLVDSVPDLHAASAAMLRGLGRAPLPLDEVRGFVGNGVARLVERCLAATGGADAVLRAEARALFDAAYIRDIATLTRPYDGVEAALDALAARGCRLGVCTNKPEAMAAEVLAGLGLAPRIAALVGGDTAGALKPDPAPLRLCHARLGGGPVLFVGDSETDAASATAAGAPFALFTGGYRKSPVESFEMVLAFDDFADLIAFVGSGLR